MSRTRAAMHGYHKRLATAHLGWQLGHMLSYSVLTAKRAKFLPNSSLSVRPAASGQCFMAAKIAVANARFSSGGYSLALEAL